MKRPQHAALDAIIHAHDVQRALATPRDELARHALTRLGPVPATCQRCGLNPPTTFLVYGAGQWLCDACK